MPDKDRKDIEELECEDIFEEEEEEED